MTDREKRWARKAYVTKRARQHRQEWVAAVKGTRCHDCGGEFDHVQIDLEHIDPSTKVASISWLVRNGTADELETELRKVIPVCRNCHALRTHYGNGRMI